MWAESHVMRSQFASSSLAITCTYTFVWGFQNTKKIVHLSFCPFKLPFYIALSFPLMEQICRELLLKSIIQGLGGWKMEQKFPGVFRSKHHIMRGASSASGKGHEEGGLAYAKAGSSLRSLPGNSRAIYSQNQSLPTFCFVLSPTPLTLRGAVPHYLSEKRVSL